MSWREQLRPGKFRTAAFHIQGHDAAGGRRLALHEYPLRDDPYAEDLGRKAREFALECFVLGADYMAARDALLAELEKAGPGTLVHPYLGTRVVAVRDFRLRESTSEGGLARFSITFVEAGRAAEPAVATDTAAAVDAAADAATDAATGEFAETFSVAGYASFVADAATAIVQDVNSTLRTAAGRIAAITSPVAEFSAQLDQLGDSLNTLMRAPANLGADLAGVVFALAGVADDIAGALNAYRDLGDFGLGAATVPTNTATRARQAANQIALHALMRRTATIEAARASAQLDFASSTDALAVRDDLVERLDTLAETAGDDVYTALVDLRAAVVTDLTTRGGLLPRAVSYTPPATLPALLLAYRLHGDASRESEIVSRNKIRHPGFVPGGVALEVLVDG